eukprot:gene24863-40300_t
MAWDELFRVLPHGGGGLRSLWVLGLESNPQCMADAMAEGAELSDPAQTLADAGVAAQSV